MTRPRRKRHLLHKQSTACGEESDNTTTHPHLVTCGRCQRTIHMADSEARAAVERRRKDAP